ncbi:MAG TPA: TIM-barrel domain-containing protein [Steroidobacteraceae bacterium]|nr:TIM-barrel domain-containing protein [Steroidobacteraceae bacterium]
MADSKKGQRGGTLHRNRAARALVPALITVSLALLGRFGPAAASVPADGGSFARIADGVVITPTAGNAKKVRVEVISPAIVRVTEFPGDSLALPPSLMAVRTGDARVGFTVLGTPGAVSLSTGKLTAVVRLSDGNVVFEDGTGREITAEVPDGRSFRPVTLEGAHDYAIRQQFGAAPGEAFYGLGQHQQGIIDYRGKDVTLAQHNMDVAVPFVVSSRDYGILWDNDSVTRFGNPQPWQQVSKSLTLYDAQGKPGALTARYYVDGKLVLERREDNIDYQYLDWKGSFPSSFPASLVKLPRVKVVWSGRIEARSAGMQTFSLYGSDYQKLWIGGRRIIDAWRQNWNPWFRDFSLEMSPGKPLPIRLEWDREGGYIALLHRPPRPAAQRDRLSLSSQAGHAIDYYFIRGSSLDQVIAGYRYVTGRAVLLPRWAYGFWQSRDHYETQQQLLGVVEQYRRLRIPLDNIVQDWRYWKDDAWGSHEFDPSRYPDPRAMIAKVHALHAHFMISVWPKFYPTTESYEALAAHGDVFPLALKLGVKDWVGPGYRYTFYDPFSAGARQLYWRQIDERLASLGVDAWWLDADEPDMISNTSLQEREALMSPTPLGPGSALFNAYPLEHVGGVYEGNLRARPNTRVFILSRSGFAGLQRDGAAVWSGDVAPRWSDLKDQIAAGVGFSLSGLPNWTMDIGGYQPEARYLHPDAKDLEEWRELNTRWFEFGAFCPLFRSHGQMPHREIYNLAAPGSAMYATLVYYDELRYRLMPYIYTLAGDTWLENSTIMRALEMDFARDPKVRAIADEYLFGPAFLVNPVYRYHAREREVYLPAGALWYDFYSNRTFHGGQRIPAAAPLARMPLFVRAGSIVPVGPAIQYTGEKPDAPLTLLVYAGASGHFALYEDEGINLDYQRGEYSTIALSFEQATGTLTIGRRSGTFPGMPKAREFRIRWMTPRARPGDDFAAPADDTVEYSGAPVKIHCASCAAGAGRT